MYQKIRFTSKTNGATAGLVVGTDRDMSIPALSRLFPMYEARKMERFEASPEFATWEAAFNYVFPEINA